MAAPFNLDYQNLRVLLEAVLFMSTDLMEELEAARLKANETEEITTPQSNAPTTGTSSEPVTSRESCSKKRRFECGECSRSRLVSKKSTKKVAAKKRKQPVCFPTPDLPESHRRLINGVGGTDVLLVMQKRLFQTDVETNNGRLSMLFSQVRHEFLTEKERKFLSDQLDETVRMIEPSMNERRITLRQWDMKKKKKKASGKVISMYVLKSQWNNVVKDNRLRTNDVIQIWSFRIREELRLALVLAERGVDYADDEEEKSDEDQEDSNDEQEKVKMTKKMEKALTERLPQYFYDY